jgi:hypothetical protein
MHALCSLEIDLVDLRSLLSFSKYLTINRQRHARKGGSAEIHRGGLMALSVYDEKFLRDVRFLFRMLPFIVKEDNNLEHPAQEQEERRTVMIGFKFPRGLKNTTTTCQAAVR